MTTSFSGQQPPSSTISLVVPATTPATVTVVPVCGLRERIRATAISIGIAALLLTTPFGLMARYREVSASTLGFQVRPEDPILLVCSLLWVALVLSIVGAYRPLRPRAGIEEMQASLRTVVADSHLGLGHYGGWTKYNEYATLALLEQPDLLALSDVGDGERGQAGEPDAVVEPDVPAVPAVMVPTVEYEVRPRDSWWAIAESLFDDPKHWREIKALNLGREPEPGVTINETTPLRSGWTVLVPIDVESS